MMSEPDEEIAPQTKKQRKTDTTPKTVRTRSTISHPEASGDKPQPTTVTPIEAIVEETQSIYKKYINSSTFSTDSAWTSVEKCIEYFKTETSDIPSFWHDFGPILKA